MPENNRPEKTAGKRRGFTPGMSGNPGGRPKKLVEIEKMLDTEHRNIDSIKEVFAQLKAMATEAVITRHTDAQGNTTESIKQPNPAFMDMYLNRVLGPVKELKVDMSDWPDEMVAFFAEKVAN